jgi:NAD+ synthase (glutamine-hydrolysing)
MGSVNSSAETRDRAKRIAASIGSSHKEIEIDKVTGSIEQTFTESTDIKPRFVKKDKDGKDIGGSMQEDLAL